MAEEEHQRQRRPVLPLKTRISLTVLNTIIDSSLRTDGTVNRYPFRLLRTLGLTAAPPNPKPFHGVATSDITVDINRNLWFRLYVPTTTDNDDDLPVIVFFHGGGFVHLAPDLKAYDNVCRRFARTVPAVVVSVDYRLTPEHRYPAQYDDGFDVLKFLDSETSVLPQKVDYSRCFLAGDSAGGNLAHHVAKRFCECNSDFHKLKVIGLIAIQPFFGGEERTKSEIELQGVDVIVSIKRTDWMWKAFMPPGSGMDRDHEVINVSGPRAADISKLNFPATMVVVAGFDSLKDWQMRYYEWLKNSGKEVYLLEYPNTIHAFFVFPELPESTQVTLDIKKFIHEQCSKAK